MQRAEPPLREPILGDAFGMALQAYLSGEDKGEHGIERDDGLLDWMTAEPYFGGPEAWLGVEATVVARCRGTVLDIGAGAGRFALELQERGNRVMALDVSPGAVAVCRRRGVTETFQGDVFELAADERFDTFLLMGNNLGLLGSADAGPVLLRHLAAMAAPGARLLGTGRDAMATSDPAHLQYHEFNRSRGRAPGQLRLRIRRRDVAGPWFDYLFCSPEELAAMAAAAGWDLRDVQSEPEGYVAELRLAG